MKGRTVSLTIVAGVALVVLSAALAWAYTGTSAGKKLAGQMLSSYKHVRYLAGSEHGSVYYCTTERLPEGFWLGPPGQVSPRCRIPATVSWIATLSDGKGASAVGTVVAHGHPTIDWVAVSHASYYRIAGTKCWVTIHQSDPAYVGYPPFGYFSREYLTLGKRHGSDIQLIGTGENGNFKEVDTINVYNHHIVGEEINFGIRTPSQRWNLTTSYSEPSNGPKMPATTPTC
jgi:hypothetical protein